jgi:hypothetical protein
MGRFAEALELSRHTLRRARHALGEDHPLTLSCMTGFAADLRARGKPEQAAELEGAALAGLTHTLGVQHPHTLAARERMRPFWDFEPDLG